VRWDPSFFRKSPLFWPIRGAAARLEHLEDWPAPADLSRLFPPDLGEPPVRFELATPKPRRRRASAEPGYDAQIALERIVPTRARSWHDLLNALVWVTFPRAKLALHARQHRMIAARVGDDLRLPGARTKEQDAVAMLDEGGVVVLRGARAEESVVVFGHAIYEGLACNGPPNVRGAAHVVEVEAIEPDASARVAAADRALARLLSREVPIGRHDFETIAISDRLVGPVDGAS
jgi:hypothetical protein